MPNTYHHENQRISTTTALICALTVVIAAVCAFAATWLWTHDIGVTHENRIIENTQVFFLLLALATHALQAGRQPVSSTSLRLCHLVLAMLCLSIMVREIDIDKLGSQPGWELAENLIRLTGGAGWIWLLTHVYRNRRPLWQCKTGILLTSASLLTGLGVLFYMASWLFDKSVVPLPAERSQLWEETLQLSGTIFLFTAALRPIHIKPFRTSLLTSS
ncbi:MAG: hypothetical protein WD071_06370 [Pseudohongiella sp.]|uniref:hypothetical protein n=1 Tax=Pseudohongiella sp. TaxID=1979412 RepID=UPI0034A0840F